MGWGCMYGSCRGGVAQGLVGFGVVYPLLIAFSMWLMWLYKLGRYEITGSSEYSGDRRRCIGPVGMADGLFCVCADCDRAVWGRSCFFGGFCRRVDPKRVGELFMPQMQAGKDLPTAYRPSARPTVGGDCGGVVAFASLHQMDQAPIIFVLSLGLGYVYERTGNLWAPIILHVAFQQHEYIDVFGGGVKYHKLTRMNTKKEVES